MRQHGFNEAAALVQCRAAEPTFALCVASSWGGQLGPLIDIKMVTEKCRAPANRAPRISGGPRGRVDEPGARGHKLATGLQGAGPFPGKHCDGLVMAGTGALRATGVLAPDKWP